VFKKFSLGFLFIRVFTGTPVTNKSLGTRMGKGKGSIAYWISIIKNGQIIIEIGGINLIIAKNIFKKCSYLLPFKSKLVKLIY